MASLMCTNCERSYLPQEFIQRCQHCNEPLEVQVNLAAAKLPFKNGVPLLQKYKPVLPTLGTTTFPSLSEGNTSLNEAFRLEKTLGLRGLFLKDERRNPTGSFKDRGTIVALQHALDLGLYRVGAVSTGNMAASVAAYAALAGLECYILVPATINPHKLGPIAIYAPHLIAVDGDYGDLYFHSLDIGQKLGIYFANSDDPYRVEGQKTIVYEICEALRDTMADYIVLPVSSGGNMGAVLKGLRELRQMGVLRSMPFVIGVQAEGASPIAKAYDEHKEHISPFENPCTVAHAISNPYPPSGNRVLRQLRGYGRGHMITVSDVEILDAQSRLAREEGLFVQPAAAAPLAGVIKLIRMGYLATEKSIVCLITGDGLKDLSVFEQQPLRIRKTTLRNLGRVIMDTLDASV